MASFLNSNSMWWINAIYVFCWGAVSFVSSFLGVLDGDLRKVISGNLLQDIFTPLFIWIIAFFGDYLYNVLSLNKNTHILNERWIKFSYVLIEALFILFLVSIHTCENGRTACIILLYLCMMLLKMSSLFVLCPRQKVESI